MEHPEPLHCPACATQIVGELNVRGDVVILECLNKECGYGRAYAPVPKTSAAEGRVEEWGANVSAFYAVLDKAENEMTPELFKRFLWYMRKETDHVYGVRVGYINEVKCG